MNKIAPAARTSNARAGNGRRRFKHDSSAPPVGSVLEGGIFDDFALLGALVFGAAIAEAIRDNGRTLDRRHRHRTRTIRPRNESRPRVYPG